VYHTAAIGNQTDPVLWHKYSHVREMCVSWYLPRWSYDVDVLRVCEEGQ